VAAFEAFCRGPARDASAVYVLGDLFDQWIGDDQLREPLAAGVARALRGVSDSGVPVGIIVGNRDFLLGPRFTAEAGAKLLPEQSIVDIAGTPTVLSHGDEMPPSEFAYLRSVYSRLDSDQLKEAVFQGMTSDPAGGRWLVERARDSNESTKLRGTSELHQGTHGAQIFPAQHRWAVGGG